MLSAEWNRISMGRELDSRAQLKGVSLLFITAVRLHPTGDKTEDITNVWWLRSDDGTAGTCTTAALIGSPDMMNHGAAFVAGSKGAIEVEIVTPPTGSPYIRTDKDSTTRDNLLSLPRF